jgi:hypothetical protein
MADRIVIGYKRLFDVRLLHHYWLDEGSAIYDTLPESKKTKLLLTYDAHTFLEINPTPITSDKIKALKGVFKQTSPGFLVAVPKSKIIPDHEVFSFVITIKNPAFFSYTALTLMNRNIIELYDAVGDKILRYKENIPVFSNLTGASRGANPNKSLFLSKEIPPIAPTDQAEFLNISAGALVQLTSSQPGATTQQINALASKMPVFVHQNDAPVIVPPAGLTGVPFRGILLSEEIPDNVFGVINIVAKNPGNPDFSCTNAGIAKETAPVFQLRFKNRSAYWKYLNKNTGAPVSESSTPLPFTGSGNAGTKRKPGDSFVKVKFENNDPTKRIEKIYAEIFE